MKNPKVIGKPVAPAPQHGHHAAKKPAPKKKTAPHKPAHVPASVRIARHKAALKAAKTRATNAKKAKHHKRRGLALTDGVACCSAEALAASLRLVGWPVSDEDVLELYSYTASGPDEGASILATLRAAREFGLAGKQLVQFGAPSSLDCIDPPLAGGFELGCPEWIWHDGDLDLGPVRHGLIVGVTLPGGPHALTLDPSGFVWSWGELYDPGQLRPGPLEEAWLVDWEV